MTEERRASVPGEGEPRAVRAIRTLRAVRAFRLGALLLVATLLAACGEGDEPRTTPAALPSGELGVVTPRAASAAVLGLCEVRAELSADPSAAPATFEDRVHEELHVIAAATEVRDRTAAATLLRAKERVEAGFGEPGAATDLAGDVGALLQATRGALAAIGLDAPACAA